MSARQAQNLMKPVGNALREREDKEAKALFEQADKSKRSDHDKLSQNPIKDIKRIYIEMDGIMERMRRGSVPMEKHEQGHKRDVYREIKVGAVFLAERGNERSELAPAHGSLIFRTEITNHQSIEDR
jgi:hypothetical protein